MGFSFNGMGGQFTIGVPEKDLMFVCTGDNQGNEYMQQLIFDSFEEFIYNRIADKSLAENEEAFNDLENFGNSLKLRICRGEKYSPFSEKINGKTFICPQNNCGIEHFRLEFNGDKCEWIYKNAQGEKRLAIGMTYNEFEKFPQLGYSNEHGGTRTTDGFMYDCAVSGGWIEERKLEIRVQVIDRYFGNFTAFFNFKDDECFVRIVKTAEDFFKEYQGEFTAKMQ